MIAARLGNAPVLMDGSIEAVPPKDAAMQTTMPAHVPVIAMMMTK